MTNDKKKQEDSKAQSSGPLRVPLPRSVTMSLPYRAVCYHQAGRAAVILALGYKLTAVWVHENGGKTLSSTSPRIRDYALIELAGALAQERAVPGSEMEARGLPKVNWYPSQEEAKAVLDANWDVVERIAKELLYYGNLWCCRAMAEAGGQTYTPVEALLKKSKDD
jgi:hypothetical protein